MANFKDDILEAVEGQTIEAVVIGRYGWNEDGEDQRGVPAEKLNKILPWSEAVGLLDYEYDTGYGGPECHAVAVWTSGHVFFVTQYDGSTHIQGLPRSPVDHTPIMPGG